MSQWATKWTLGEKSKVHFCKIQLVLDVMICHSWQLIRLCSLLLFLSFRSFPSWLIVFLYYPCVILFLRNTCFILSFLFCSCFPNSFCSCAILVSSCGFPNSFCSCATPAQLLHNCCFILVLYIAVHFMQIDIRPWVEPHTFVKKQLRKNILHHPTNKVKVILWKHELHTFLTSPRWMDRYMDRSSS